jgi:DNA-binding winged helix-turn-helix (wHTH) protein
MVSLTTPKVIAPTLLTCVIEALRHDAAPSLSWTRLRRFDQRLIRHAIEQGWLERLPLVEATDACHCGEYGCVQRLVERDSRWWFCCTQGIAEDVPVERDALVEFRVQAAPLLAQIRAENPFAASPTFECVQGDIYLIGERILGNQRVAVMFVGAFHATRVPYLIGLLRRTVEWPILALTAEEEIVLPLAHRDALWRNRIYPVPLTQALAAPHALVVRDDVLLATLGGIEPLPGAEARPRLLIDRLNQQAWWHGELLTLPPQLYLLLEILALSAIAGEAFVSRERIGEHVWGDVDTLPNSIDTALTSLRRVLSSAPGAAPDVVKTVKKRGVRLLVSPTEVHIREPGSR